MKRTYALICFAALGINGCHRSPFEEGISKPETHYSPAENLEAIDRSALDQAQRTIDFCAYSLTDFSLGDALKRAGLRGVRVRVYLDRNQTAGELSREERRAQGEESEDGETTSGILRQLSLTPNIEVRIKHSRTLMHLKSYAVDDSLLRSGSANFSPTGEKRQDNDLTFTADPDAITHFEQNFEVIWGRPDNEPLALH